jgi:hypothetical protein
VRVGLGADWSTSGSRNLLGELRVARAASLGRIPARDLVAMATRDAAAILGWDKALGTLEPGKRADLVVLAGTGGDPYDALVHADEADVRLVMIDGAPRAGSEALMRALGANGETVRFGDCTRVVALRDAVADPAVPFVELGRAKDEVRGALRTLPQMARILETSVPREPSTPSGGEPPIWYLALDELGGTGAEVRPRLGARPERRKRGGSVPLSQLVQPLDLDPLTISGDDGYWDAVRAQRNLPAEVREGLEA